MVSKDDVAPGGNQGLPASKLEQLAYVQDYHRLGLGSLASDDVEFHKRKNPCRLTLINNNYSVCKSYPAVLAVPRLIPDDDLAKIAELYRNDRFPVMIWRHPRNGCVLFRSSGLTTDAISEMTKTWSIIRGDKKVKAMESISNTDLIHAMYLSSITKTIPRVSELNPIRPDEYKVNAVYVLGEKDYVKGARSTLMKMCHFTPAKYPDKKDMNSSYCELFYACQSGSKHFLSKVSKSKWLEQVKNIIEVACTLVEIIDSMAASVIVSLEDGLDYTAQVVSMTELLLDPYYRTIEGFSTLVQKEWEAFGYPFGERCSASGIYQPEGYVPVFLQFLDAVHQVWKEFPMSFQFNEYFLKFIAYQISSTRFRTFTANSEYDRFKAGWFKDDSDTDSVHSSTSLCLWANIDFMNKQAPIFYNFLYSSPETTSVLRPYSNLANIDIWQYHLEYPFEKGISHLFEYLTNNQKIENDPSCREMVESSAIRSGEVLARQIFELFKVLRPYSNLANIDIWQYHREYPFQRSLSPLFEYLANNPRSGDDRSCREVVHSSPMISGQVLSRQIFELFKDIAKLEVALGRSPEPWPQLWERLRLTTTQTISPHALSTSQQANIMFHASHKIVNLSNLFYQPHRFQKAIPSPDYRRKIYCDYCHYPTGTIANTAVQCTNCGYYSHQGCVKYIPKNCLHLYIKSSRQSATRKSFMKREADLAEKGLRHEGYLCKKGRMSHKWVQRWFVLDPEQRKLFYYYSPGDFLYKGFIDCDEIFYVNGFDFKISKTSCTFELITAKGLQIYIAQDHDAAVEWVDKLLPFVSKAPVGQ